MPVLHITVWVIDTYLLLSTSSPVIDRLPHLGSVSISLSFRLFSVKRASIPPCSQGCCCKEIKKIIDVNC